MKLRTICLLLMGLVFYNAQGMEAPDKPNGGPNIREQANERMFEAISLSDVRLLEVALKQSACVHVHDHEGYAPLYCAIEMAILNNLEVALSEESINNTDRRAQQLSIISLLIDRGATVNQLAPDGLAPHHRAAFLGDLEVVRLLCQRGARIDFESATGAEPLFYAVAERHLHVAKWLLEQGARSDAATHNGVTALQIGVLKGDLEIIKLLFSHMPEGNDAVDRYNALIPTAAQYGQQNIIDWLIEAGARVDAVNGGADALHRAVENNHLAIARMLLESGVAIDAQDSHGFKAIHIAAEKGNEPMLELLLEMGADLSAVNNSGFLPLHSAVQRNSLEGVEWLSSHGANVSARDTSGAAPLHVAAASGHLRMIEWLMVHGADLSAKTNRGIEPLYAAAAGGHIACVEWLITHGVAPDYRRLFRQKSFVELLKHVPLIRALFDDATCKAENLLGESALTPEELSRALLLAIALKRDGLIGLILENKVLTCQALYQAAETATVMHDHVVFEQLYREMVSRRENGTMCEDEFLNILKNALYWAGIVRNEELARFIERASLNGDDASVSLPDRLSALHIHHDQA